MMSKVVYHTTSTLNLPWIIESGELQPALITDIGIGWTKFIWATTKRAGDKTSGSMWLIRYFGPAWQAGLFGVVRLTLPAKGFLTWREVIRREGWTKIQVARLEADDRRRIGEDGHAQWRCRYEPLPLANVLKAEVKTFAGRWRPLDLDPGRVVRTEDPLRMGYRLGRKVLFSERINPKKFLCIPPGLRPSKDDEPAPPEFGRRQVGGCRPCGPMGGSRGL